MKIVAVRSHPCGARCHHALKVEEIAQRFIYGAFNNTSARQDAGKKKVLSKETKQ
jgi:hypothetical protein